MAGVGATERTGQADSSQQIDDTEGAGGPDKSNSSSGGEGNHVVKGMKRSESPLKDKDLQAVLAALHRLKESGSDLTPDQKASAVRAEWEAKKSAYDSAVATNDSADSQIAARQDQKKHLGVLYASGQMGEGVLTWKELEYLRDHGSEEEKAAANWMIQNKADFWDSMEKGTTTFDVNGVPNLNGEPLCQGPNRKAFQDKVEELDRYIAEALASKVPLPANPGPAPSSPSSSSQATTGAGTGTNGTGGTSGTSTGQTQATSADVDARVFGNYKKVPPFSSSATSPEGRLQDAGSHIQKGIDALQEDLIAASTKSPPNQAEIMMIQNKMQQVQSAFAAVMQMMKQLQEMQSNMSKMFSDMAASAIRNMR